MQHMEIAQRMGLTLMDIECLVKGQATAKLAAKFGVTTMDVQEFARGKATSCYPRT
jgi:hypothetical protein